MGTPRWKFARVRPPTTLCDPTVNWVTLPATSPDVETPVAGLQVTLATAGVKLTVSVTVCPTVGSLIPAFSVRVTLVSVTPAGIPAEAGDGQVTDPVPLPLTSLITGGWGQNECSRCHHRVLVRENVAGVAIPATVALTLKLPAVALAEAVIDAVPVASVNAVDEVAIDRRTRM